MMLLYCMQGGGCEGTTWATAGDSHMLLLYCMQGGECEGEHIHIDDNCW